MKVIGAGFIRTGTLSLQSNLRSLGYNPYHGRLFDEDHKADKERHIEFFTDALEKRKTFEKHEIDFDSFLVSRGYDSLLGTESAIFYKDLYQRYPGSKVILTVRDFDTWYNSFYNQIWNVDQQARLNNLNDEYLEYRNKLYRECFGTEFNHREIMKRAYNGHIDKVIKSIPTWDLMLFNLDEGWESLCMFLGKQVPDTRFINELDYETTDDFFKRNHPDKLKFFCRI